MAHLLIVDDEPAITKSLSVFFERNGGHLVTRAHSGAEGVRRFMQDRPDLVFLDLSMPDVSGFEVLEQIRSYDPVVIVITAHGDVPVAVEAIKKGAENFILKPLDLSSLSVATEKALEKVRLKRLHEISRAKSNAESAEVLMGSSPSMQDLIRQIELLAAEGQVSGMLLGESGTGKGRIATLIHQMSGRSDNPFLEVNCAVVGDFPLEFELFGLEDGLKARSLLGEQGRGMVGAQARQQLESDESQPYPGAFELADHGTLFLDEIADLPVELQPRVLDFLNGNGVQRVGSDSFIFPDVRILAATSKDLISEVNKGRFREDLYYRLSPMLVQIPPLRARTQDDLVALIGNILRELRSYVTEGPQELADDALEYLLAYSWPGNIRELRNVIEKSLLVARSSDTIRPEHLPVEVRNAFGVPDAQIPRTLAEVEMAHIHRVLRATRLNRTQAAKALGISRATLVKKIKLFGLLTKGGA